VTVSVGGLVPQAAYDVVVIGAGVVGCAIAGALARHRSLRMALVEARDDVGLGALLHRSADQKAGPV